MDESKRENVVNMHNSLLVVNAPWKLMEQGDTGRKTDLLTSHHKYAIMSVYHVEDHRLPAVFSVVQGRFSDFWTMSSLPFIMARERTR
jgi:hypothetical protein